MQVILKIVKFMMLLVLYQNGDFSLAINWIIKTITAFVGDI